MNNDPDISFFTRENLRDHLGVSMETIKRWIKLGKIPPPVINFGQGEGWHPEEVRKIRAWYMKTIPRAPYNHKGKRKENND